ncbi:hypothetical protein ACWHA1_01735 [Streptomyces decoyicus]
MFRQRPKCEEHSFSEPRKLRSNTPGISFTAVFTARWEINTSDHYTAQSLAINQLVHLATSITKEWEATNSRGAEDAVNATLGFPVPITGMPKSKLSGRVSLSIGAQELTVAEQQRQDKARVARLRYLKEQLYSDPEMLLLEYLDQHPEALTLPSTDIRVFQRLSRSMRVGGEWWYPLLDCLEKISADLPEQRGDLYAMRLLLKAFKDAVPNLVDKHGLRAQIEGLLQEGPEP